MQIAFPLLVGSLCLSQTGGLGTAPRTRASAATPRTYPPQPYTPHSGTARWPYGVPEQNPDRDHHSNHRERFPYLYGADSAVIPFAYGLPSVYGGNIIEDPIAGQATAQPPSPPADASEAPGNRKTDEVSPPQAAANTEAARFRPLYQRPANQRSVDQGSVNQGPATFAPVRPQPATTLIFKDGRPPAQVHNYALTASTLYALDGESRQEIPLSWLNVPATVEANRAAGVEFALPERR